MNEKAPLPTVLKNPAIDSALETLRDFLKLDPEGCKKLLDYRVKTTKALAEHAFVQVAGSDENPTVGLIGLLNGILEPVSDQRIAVCFDGDAMVGFQIYTPPKVAKPV